MDKKIYLVRHAQGEHNIENNFNVSDAILTPLGKSQCATLSSTFPHHDSIGLVLSSPLKRAIQTAVYSFAPVLKRGVKVVLTPMAQEISAKNCDVGSERKVLEEAMEEVLGEEGGKVQIDYEGVEEGWCLKKGVYEDSLQAVEARAAALRTWLLQRPEKEIVLVTHGAFLHYLTEDWDGFEAGHGTAYKNCEYRCFTFAEDSSTNEAHLVQIGKVGERVAKPRGTHSMDITGVELN